MKRYFLIGYMGSGKTTIGRRLAELRGIKFIDLDHYIEGRHQKTISQIFDAEGEDKFREIERNILRELADFEDVLIATGGGTPCFFDNMDYMNQHGQTIYLKASSKVLCHRLRQSKTTRPLIVDKTDEALLDYVAQHLDKRNACYNKAHIIFDTEDFLDISALDQFVEKLNQLL